MKNRIFAVVAAVLLVTACRSPFLPTPLIPQEGDSGSGAIKAPENLTATHGKKRSIELTWDEVPGAVRYNISRANNPLEFFVQCGETTETEFTLDVSAGITGYYRVSFVSSNGTESAQSPYVMGSSLAQPLITDIGDVTESEATVTWYMDNVSDKTYKSDLRYMVYCFAKTDGAAVASLALDGSQLEENKAVFTGLLSEKEYSYQVEAYLVNDQDKTEKSEIMDKETAHRFKPGAPVNLAASRGAAVGEVKLTFELPEMVNIALNANQFELHGLYFVISRKFGDAEFLDVCSYFGPEDTEGKTPNAASKGSSADFFSGKYVYGTAVSWSDTNVVRGAEYEYQIQAYVDTTTRTISSDTSKGEATGWPLAEGTLSLGEPSYTPNTAKELNIMAELPLRFKFDSKGEEYRYVVLETIKPIEDENDLGYNPVGEIVRKSAYLTEEEINKYRATMNLTQKCTDVSPGRGLYSYEVDICLPDRTVVDKLVAVGDVQIEEDINPIKVWEFHVTDGYTDKFAVTWQRFPSREYVLYESADGINDWKIIKTYPHNSTASENDPPINGTDNILLNSLTNYGKDKPIYFAMQAVKQLSSGPKKGQRVYTDDCWTLGEPKQLKVDGHSYSTLTAAWNEAKKADAYQISYRYKGTVPWKNTGVVSRNALSLNAYNQLQYSFKPYGTALESAEAGEEIELQVKALNNEVGSSTVSVTETTQLVGPAKLGLKVSQAEKTDYIEVSWNKVDGADGYYVFRRQFAMDNSAEESAEVVRYYVSAHDNVITGKNIYLKNEDNSIVDTANVTAAVTYTDPRYTLQDKYMNDTEYNGKYTGHIDAYRNQQNELAWGYPYRYYVVPVINRNGDPESLSSIKFTYDKHHTNANTGINSLTIQENKDLISYSGAAALEKTGFTIGFGQNVVATKGTYIKSPSSNPIDNVNDGVKITWTLPPELAKVPGFSPRYTVYRRESGSNSAWETLKFDVSAREYIDVQLPNEGRGRAHEYVIGIANGSTGGSSDPKSFKRFIDQCYADRDDRNRPLMLGFMLEMVKMESVSRNDQRVGNDFAEEVKWKSAGIKHRDGVGYKWGIDGYEVYVMNRNINGGWHLIKNIPFNNIPDGLDQSVKVTNNDGTPVSAGGISHKLLKVLRDYKHYFKIRSYVLNDFEEKVYCPDPPFVYQYWGGANMTSGTVKNQETDYVKWGARQISADEFIQISTLYMAEGIERVNGTQWNTGNFGRSANNSGNYGASGSLYAESDFWVNSWELEFRNYKGDLLTRAGDWQTFITIQGGVWAGTGASNQYPQRYGWSPGSWGNKLKGFMTITGPSDTPGLYSGKIAIGGGNDLAWGTGGFIYVNYPTANMNTTHASDTANPKTLCEKIPYRGQDTPLVFTGQGDKRYQQETWK